MPTIRYLETISRTAEAEGRYIRQTGGQGNYGHVKLRLEPNQRGKGIEFLNEVKGDVIPQQFIQHIEAGIREAARGGILAGYEVVDFKAALCDGSSHEIDSNDMAFQIAASLAFKEAAKKATPMVLEPVMSVVFTALESQGSTLFTEISARNGRIEDVKIRDALTVRAQVPLQQMLSWSGPGSYVMQFSGYEPVPRDDPADESGVAARRPRGPAPKSDSAAANPDLDWT